jgi:flagellar protein FliS
MTYAAKAYSANQNQTDVLIAKPNELIILVYERVFDNLKLGMNEMEQDQYGTEYFSKAGELINFGLLSTLNLSKGGEIAANLSIIYKWALTELNIARVQKSPEKIQNILNVLTPLYEGWVEILPTNK